MYWLSTLSVLAAVPLGLGTVVVRRWDDMRVKHTSNRRANDAFRLAACAAADLAHAHGWPNADQELPGFQTDIGSTEVPNMCSTTIAPTCLRALYNTSTYVPAATGKNWPGIAE